jgi:NADH-quinone oxidoreductase subunit D
MGRIGGFERDWSPEAFRKLDVFLEEFPVAWKEFENLFERNRIFMDRTINVGSISAEQAISYGFTGPNLRAAELITMYVSHSPTALMTISIL